MRAEIRSIISTDIGGTALEDYRPDNPDHIYLLVRIWIGSDELPGEDVFDIVVCTPSGINERLGSEGHVWGKNHLIVRSWDWDYLRSTIYKLIDGASGTDLEAIMRRLSDYGGWVDYE